jgi:Aspartyl protease
MATFSLRAFYGAIVATALVLASFLVLAHAATPTLKSNSKTIDIRDGERLLKAAWTVDPAVALDVYDAVRTARSKKVTFISDIDSISFDVEPGRTYDFTILLNEKQACRTRISTMTQSFKRGPGAPASGPVSIPISITRGKLHLRGAINGSDMLNLIFDTGADITAVYPSAARAGVALKYDGAVSNVGTGGVTARQTSSTNQLDVAGLRWEHEPVMFIDKQADVADGIVGYTVFQEKVVEIDFDRMMMTIHDSLPTALDGFNKVAMPFAGALTSVGVALGNDKKRVAGQFVIDTGGTGAMNINHAFAAANPLQDIGPKVGNSRSTGVGPGVVQNEVRLIPEMTIAGFTLRDVPVHIEQAASGDTKAYGGSLNMAVLSRFNFILDFARNEAHFKPNKRFSAPFKY